MFYVIGKSYIGPNPQQFLDADTVEIRNAPEVHPFTGGALKRGASFAYNDWATVSHGEFETLEDARAEIAKTFGETRSSSDVLTTYPSLYLSDPIDVDKIVEVHKIGQYEPMGERGSSEFAYNSVYGNISADTTDEDIERLVGEWVEDARDMGYELDVEAAQETAIMLRDEEIDQSNA